MDPANIVKSLLHCQIILMILAAPSANAQEQKKSGFGDWLGSARYSMQTGWQQGGVFATNEFLQGLNAAGVPVDHHRAFTLRVARQTVGGKFWEANYGYPRYGIGLYAGDYFTSELGNPFAAYGFLAGPLLRAGRLGIQYEYAIGLAFNWNEYDPLTNPYNIAVGSDLTSYVEAGIHAEIRLLDVLYASLGAGLTHTSNGAILLPNRGVNNYFWRFALRNEFNSGVPYRAVGKRERFRGSNEWIAATFFAFKRAEIPVAVGTGERIPTIPVTASGLFGIYQRRLLHKISAGAGFQLCYNGLVNPVFEPDGDTVRLIREFDSRRIELSVFPSMELVFNRFSIFAHAGFYLIRNELLRNSPTFYQRTGFKFYLTDRLFAAVQIRARSVAKAVMIEWTAGYRF